MGPRRCETRLLDRVDVLGGGAKSLDALLRHIVEESVAVRMERGAVVECQGRPAGECAHLPVPHHPAAGGEVKEPLSALHVAMQRQLLDVLQQRAAGAVHDAFRGTGGARRVHDVERVVEGEAFEFDLRGGVPGDEIVQCHGLLDRRDVGCGRGVRHDDDAFDRRNSGRHRPEPTDGIEPLTAVEVSVRAEQHLRRDLAESIHDALHAEIR